MRSQGERETHTQLHRESPKISRKDKRAFSEQRLVIEEISERGRRGDLFRKTGNIKGTFHPKMGR